MTSDSAQALSIVRDMYNLIDRQQWDEHAALISRDFRSVLGTYDPMTFKEWQSRVKRIYDAFPNGRHAVEFYVVEGGRVLTVGRFQGVHTGMFMDRPASGRSVSAAVMHVDRVENGKITEHIAQLDILGLLGQIDASF
ncbi:ester cyclase [Lichenihabitans sp. PAMC28606]|uniref:ester cyclase n=1 Tax=Lichenihabitans sp. PAMC28606 TaxID=2880932 RepID=UPI001D0B581C|nr:ester cyclase [Lichenihabitans sp. PAMC28606]UDL94066.1 ester cyclase [Lichenihabitans sp. PAMC28606]